MYPTVKVVDNKLVIELPLQAPTPSASGTTLLVASTRGSLKTGALVEGRPVTVSVNAYIGK